MSFELNGIEVLVGAMDLSPHLVKFNGGNFYWTLVFDDVPTYAYRLLQASHRNPTPVFIAYPENHRFQGVSFQIEQMQNAPSYNYQQSAAFRLNFIRATHFDFTLNFYFFAHPLDTYINGRGLW